MTSNYEVPEQIANRYDLYQELGRGRLGVVYMATDRLTGQHVALKRIVSLAQSAEENINRDSIEFRIRLARAFRILTSLRHPHIIAILDYGFDQNRLPYFTMEYLPSSQTFLQAGRNQSPAQQINLVVQLLQAAAYLHRRGILHQDLKPGNVLVTTDGIVKVLDFGLTAKPEALESADEIAGKLLLGILIWG